MPEMLLLPRSLAEQAGLESDRGADDGMEHAPLSAGRRTRGGFDQLARYRRFGDTFRMSTRLSRAERRRGIGRTLAELLGEDDEPMLPVAVVSLLTTRDDA
ncbi:hypothetical protein ACWDFL_16255 [Streptomyces bungoensis]